MKRIVTLLFFVALCLVAASCNEEPQTVSVTGISLNSSSLDLVEGETAELVATISPKDAENQTVIWSSTNGSVASVNNGKVTALKAGSTTITAKSDDGGFTASCSVTVAPKIIEVTSVSLSKTELLLIEGDSETIVATVEPDNATDKTVIWSSSDSSVATVEDGNVIAVKEGTTTISAKSGNQSAACKVTVEKKPAPVAIDLGLSVKWASFNVGASKPEEYGDYYAWGETVTKEIYYDNTYKWFEGDNLTKYNTDPLWGTVDNKTVLELEDDAAYVNLGEDWRTPTYEEWRELKENCSWAWTSVNGIDGFTVTSESNGNSIFLPAAGWIYGNTSYKQGASGYYWSSTLYYKPEMCHDFQFSQHSIEVGHTFRRNGQPIRPVQIIR